MSAPDPQSDPDEGYLWDRRGEPPADVRLLERGLASLRYRPTPLIFDRGAAQLKHAEESARRRLPLRAAALLGMFIGGAWAMSLFSTAKFGSTHDMSGSMKVVAIQGQPRSADQSLVGEGVLRPGQWIETDSDSSARILVGGLGSVIVAGDSRVRLVHVRPAEQRLELARGTISAVINAPPRLFVVDTPAAAAVDLGCAYRLTVDERGDGVIEVTRGWVSIESPFAGMQPSIVPYGTMCLMRKGRTPGTPFQSDATPALIRALERFDFEDGSTAALDVVLSESREEDSVTLWHLLSRTNGADRARVFDRLSKFLPPPSGVSRAMILRGDASALTAWRDEFTWSPAPPTSPIMDN